MDGEPPPAASREEDLPGYQTSCSRLLPPLPSIRRCFLIFLLFLAITPIGSSVARTISNDVPAGEHIQGTKYEPPEHSPDEEVEYVEEEEEEEEETGLAGPYDAASPIRHDPRLEEYRQAYIERECEGWCFSGGNCSVHIDAKTYVYTGKMCKCPQGYTGKRCEEHYVRTLYSSQGHQQIERMRRPPPAPPPPPRLTATTGFLVEGNGPETGSAVPALAFLFIMVTVAVGLAVYSYRKITKRNITANDSSRSWRSGSSPAGAGYGSSGGATAAATTAVHSPEYYLRRTGGVYNSRSPFSPKTSPRGFGGIFDVDSPLLMEGGHLTSLRQTTIGAPTPATTTAAAPTRNTTAGAR